MELIVEIFALLILRPLLSIFHGLVMIFIRPRDRRESVLRFSLAAMLGAVPMSMAALLLAIWLRSPWQWSATAFIACIGSDYLCGWTANFLEQMHFGKTEN